jgi:glucose/arabinose dehydrogenase
MRTSSAGVLVFLCLLVAGAPPRRVPDAPPITEPASDGMVLNPADVHMQAGPFNDPGGGTHASSDWEIWKVSGNELVWNAAGVTDPFLKVHVHLADAAFVGSYAGRTALEFDVDYRLQVRFRDNLGQPSADSIRLFRTSVAGPPGVPAPIPWVPFEPNYRIELVASGLQLPVNIAFIPNPGTNPDSPFFYVTELYGKIQVVRRNGTVTLYAGGLLNYDPSAGGIPGSGEQGLAGICVAPNGDVYATLMEDVAGNHLPKVVHFTSGDGGCTGSISNTLLMTGQAQGPSHQISHCSINPVDGLLYVHSGDGFDPATAQNLDSWLGKVLRMNLDLTPAAGNPYLNAGDGITARDYIFAYGMRNPFGGAWRASNDGRYSVENGPSVDRLARIVADRNLGFDNTDASMATFAIHNWAPAHAPVNLAFVQPETFFGSGYPASKMDRAYVTLSGGTHAQGPQPNGKRIVEFQLGAGDGAPLSGPTTFVEYTGTGYASAAALAAGPDGLYFSDLYKDQPIGGDPPSAAGANIYRVRYLSFLPTGTGTGFEARYYRNTTLTGIPVTRTDPVVDLNCPGATSPLPSFPGDNFSVRWRGLVEPRTTDNYTFTTSTDDGVRLRIDGVLVIDNWAIQSLTNNSATLPLVAGQKYLVELEYFDSVGDAVAKLSWSGPSQSKQVIPQSQVYAPPPLPPQPAPKKKSGCGSTGLEGLVVLLLLRAIRRVRE